LQPHEQNALNQALDGLWVKFLPLTEDRVDLLELAAAACAANRLSTEDQQAAAAAAHKLAGVLGTFGLAEGTALARELEVLYSGQSSPDPALGARLVSIADQLRSIVQNRK
jgi:HPt (histidine-containing phosphotransfer) domain-containing protein